ncbi:MAG TPA: transcription-repair coupling factor, partial [Chromatiaceae bacterium]|nr:transcription-repair coupling factor [Chromatiaceae bacterium]
MRPETGKTASPFSPPLPGKGGERLQWGRCQGALPGLAIASAAREWPELVVAVTRDLRQARQLEQELSLFLEGTGLPILHFPDWETLPYDVFSPLPELVSERLLTLHQLQTTRRGVLIVPVATLQQRILPPEYLDTHALILELGQQLEIGAFREQLDRSGYQRVSQVMAHGEFAVRGSLLDLFPMGSEQPYRIDLFDDEIDSIRIFDPETQRTTEKVEAVRLLPAREFPIDRTAITRF